MSNQVKLTPASDTGKPTEHMVPVHEHEEITISAADGADADLHFPPDAASTLHPAPQSPLRIGRGQSLSFKVLGKPTAPMRVMAFAASPLDFAAMTGPSDPIQT